MGALVLKSFLFCLMLGFGIHFDLAFTRTTHLTIIPTQVRLLVGGLMNVCWGFFVFCFFLLPFSKIRQKPDLRRRSPLAIWVKHVWMFLVSLFCYVLDKWKVASVVEMGPTPTYKKQRSCCWDPVQTWQCVSAQNRLYRLLQQWANLGS